MDTVEVRAYLSTLLIILFPIVAVTGILLYFAPSGPYDIFGVIDKELTESIHTYSGFAFAVVAVIHLFVNWPMYMGEIKILGKR